MTTTATHYAPKTTIDTRERIDTTNTRRLTVAGISGALVVLGLIIFSAADEPSVYAGELVSTGQLIGSFVLSIGSIFCFPALLTYLLARR